MTLTGCLAELSLPEIFWILEQGHHSGLLTLGTLSESGTQKIWFCQGRIVAASDGLTRSSLLSVVGKMGGTAKQIVPRPLKIPMGDYLRSQGLIEPLQLQHLLQERVKQPVCAMFQLADAKFKFVPGAPLPLSQMTGLSLSVGEVTLAGLRQLTDWNHLKQTLPAPTSSLLTVRKMRLGLQLDSCEWQVWEFANGKVSLDAIAWQTGFPLQNVQQIAFRLMGAGLAKEVCLGIPDSIPVL